MAEEAPEMSLQEKGLLIVGTILGGFLAGIILGRRKPTAEQPSLGALLGSLGGVTVGVYALVITGRFIAQGLIPA